jgi:hypothetical protein
MLLTTRAEALVFDCVQGLQGPTCTEPLSQPPEIKMLWAPILKPSTRNHVPLSRFPGSRHGAYLSYLSAGQTMFPPFFGSCGLCHSLWPAFPGTGHNLRAVPYSKWMKTMTPVCSSSVTSRSSWTKTMARDSTCSRSKRWWPSTRKKDPYVWKLI